MKKKRRRRLLTRKKKRIISAFFYPLIQGIKDTIELVLICSILAMFRWILTGKAIFTRAYSLQILFLMFALIAITASEMYVIREKSLFDFVVIKLMKTLRFFLSVFSVFVVIVM